MQCIIKADCDYCYECIEICPNAALTSNCCGMIEYNPETCTYCEVCMDVCPQEAIMIMEVDEK
jgi:formate hydrogenlyase subunit 6/NADH:ubiquinone oxidoreductase subunit I